MNVLVPLLGFALLFVAWGVFLYWDEHPAVVLKRQIKHRVRQEREAQAELEAGFEKAKADMERQAGRWNRP